MSEKGVQPATANARTGNVPIPRTGAGTAKKQMAVAERYRSYVINYNAGLDLVRSHVKNWEMFRELISTPMLPSDLR